MVSIVQEKKREKERDSQTHTYAYLYLPFFVFAMDKNHCLFHFFPLIVRDGPSANTQLNRCFWCDSYVTNWRRRSQPAFKLESTSV